jgi:hypothetical protein
MAWTTPRNWTTGELATAALLNAHLRDNLNLLKTSISNDGITWSGNVGTSRSVAGALVVSVTNTSATGYGAVFATAANDSTRYSLQAAGNTSRTDLIVLSNGHVGVGTAAPNINAYSTTNRVLTVEGNGNTDNSFGVIEVYTSQADADAKTVGQIDMGLGQPMVRLTGKTSGATAGNRGGSLQIATKANGGSFNVGMYMDNAGQVAIGHTGPSYLFHVSTSPANYVAAFTNGHASTPQGVVINYTGASPNGTGNSFLVATTTAAGDFFQLRSNGGLANYSGNNANLSDATVKDLFGPAPSMRASFRQLAIVLGHYKTQPREVPDVMFTAQQVQTVYPSLVEEFAHGKLGVREHGIKMRAYKVIQEHEDVINDHETRLAALERRATPRGWWRKWVEPRATDASGATRDTRSNR